MARRGVAGRFGVVLVGCVSVAALAGACGKAVPTAAAGSCFGRVPSAGPAPRTGRSGGWSLRRVWERPVTGSPNVTSAGAVIGDTVATLDDTYRHLVLLDAGTGRVLARRTLPAEPAGAGPAETVGEVTAVTDEQGRELIGLGHTGLVTRVYDRRGRLVWRADRAHVTYVGGYVVESDMRPGGHGGEVVIRERSGHVLERLPHGGGLWNAANVVSVRPGRLAVLNGGPLNRPWSRWLDLTHPKTPEWRPITAPRPAAGRPEPVAGTALAGDGALYVRWILNDRPTGAGGTVSGGDHTVWARYDPPRPAPAWRLRCDAAVISDLVTDPWRGTGTLTYVSQEDSTLRAIDPRTGHRIGPPGGWTPPARGRDRLGTRAMRGGYLYVGGNHGQTWIIDIHTGTTVHTYGHRNADPVPRTPRRTFRGITPNGYLVFETWSFAHRRTISAYHPAP